MSYPVDSQGPSPTARRRVGVIGVGRAGVAIATALARAGHQTVSACAVSDASQLRARQLLPGVPVMSAPAVLAEADLVLLTVRDDALAEVVTRLAAAGASFPGRILAHASGYHGLRVLDEATRRGALPLAMHPVMTFTGRPDDVDKMGGIYFGVTAPEELKPLARALVTGMGGNPVFIDEPNRALYHAAIAGAANHLVTLTAQAAELLSKAGVPDPNPMLRPILFEALDNALRLGDLGLTGPVARGDAETIAGHIDALSQVSAAALRAYLALAELTANRALGVGILAQPRAQDVLDMLAGAQR